MGKKFKDYYDLELATLLARKISAVKTDFNGAGFISHYKERYQPLEFHQRQDLFVECFTFFLPEYRQALKIFEKILGPELEVSSGMFVQGWWLWPIGRYVEKKGDAFPDISINFIYELTKRFTGEFAIRSILQKHPKKTLKTLKKWSLDENVHVRRLSSEAIRISLPWSKKLFVFVENYKECKDILNNLKADPEKFVQKSVANNINDLLKVRPDLALEILKEWKSEKSVEGSTLWIIKHATRNIRKGKLKYEL